MEARDYVLALGAIISGLAVTDIVVSAHRLIRARDRVRWDLLPLLTAAWALCLVTFSWFVSWASTAGDYNPSYARFWILLAQLICLYLMSAACLPDEVPEAGLDLRRFYERNSVYFWSAALALFITFIAALLVSASGPASRLWLLGLGLNTTIGAACALLVVNRRRSVHLTVASALIVLTLAVTLPTTLNG